MTNQFEERCQLFLDALLRGDRAACKAMTKELLSRGVSTPELYIDLFQRALYEIGRLWEAHQISVATEIVATSIVEELIAFAETQMITAEWKGKRAIFACIPGELHQIGAKMVADIFEINGWNCRFLGADTPIADLLEEIAKWKPDVLGLSSTTGLNAPALFAFVQEVVAKHSDLTVLVGGQLNDFIAGTNLTKLANVKFIRSRADLDAYLKSA
jgi:methanogenic corrinoid protein MtbC1